MGGSGRSCVMGTVSGSPPASIPYPPYALRWVRIIKMTLPQTLASGPDHRLVWLLGRVLALECEEEATNPWRAEWLVERSICCLGQGTTPNFDFNEFCYLVVTYLLLNISLFRRHSRNCCFPSGQNSADSTYVLDAISRSMSDLSAESKT